MRLTLPAPLVLLFTACAATQASNTRIAPREQVERLFYMTGSDGSFESFREHIDQISVVGPQVFRVDSSGAVSGGVAARVLDLASEHDVKVMPLIVNPGFDKDIIQALLNDAEARARAVRSMVQLAEQHGYWGWQFDFENIRESDRDSLTRFYREAADALHDKGFVISIAVVPSDGPPADPNRFQQYMHSYWRGSFDIRALAEIGDFISLMTYAQHGSVTPPGPIAGLPWMRDMLEYALSQGVPREKLSLGIPAYSGYWYADWSEERGAGVRGAEIHYDRAVELLQQNGATRRWLPEQGSSFAFWANGGTFEWVFLEDRRAFESKLGLFDAYPGLRGISVWVLGAEDPRIWEVLSRAGKP
jgi:spore germination protein YaaH